MNRRRLLALLSVLPFGRRALGKPRHRGTPRVPAGSAPPLVPGDDVKVRRTYARVGEVVTCENGHPICTFLDTVCVGDMQCPDADLGDWRQRKPKVGETPLPVCEICGAPFYRGWGLYHIGNSWRDPLGDIRGSH